MVAALADTIVVAVGGVLTALIGAGFAFAGVLVNARSQSRARPVTLDPDELATLRAEILDRDHRIAKLEQECDYWRDEAMRWMPQRRRDDNPEETPA